MYKTSEMIFVAISSRSNHKMTVLLALLTCKYAPVSNPGYVVYDIYDVTEKFNYFNNYICDRAWEKGALAAFL